MVSGLRAAHEVGIVHRDLKPANILIDDSEKAVITDFGIARSTMAGTFATAAGAIIGTLAYMAPEQATGKPVDQRADIYAFGLILSEMLVGKRGSSGGDTALALLIERASHAPPRMRTIDPTIPEALDRVVARCVEPDPAARYQTTKDLEEALERLDAEGHERHATPAAPVAPPAQGARWPAVAAAIALGLALGLGAWVLIRPAANAPPPAAVAYSPKLGAHRRLRQQGERSRVRGLAGAGAEHRHRGRVVHHDLLTHRRPGAPRAAQAGLEARRALGAPHRRQPGHQCRADGFESRRAAPDICSGSRPWTRRMARSWPRPRQQWRTRPACSRGSSRSPRRCASQLGDTTPESARRAAAETVTTTSLDALHSYSIAQDLSSTGRWVESIEHYQKAISLDGNFGRAYSGWGTSLHNLGRRDESAEVWKKALPLMDRMTDREKYRTLGAYFLGPGPSYEEAIDNYTKLVAAYPTDRAGEHNLALAYFQALDLPQAIAHGRRAVDIYPKDTRARNNLALYLMYAGDFKSAAEEANRCSQQNPAQYKAYLPLAAAAFASSDLAGARGAYERMAKVGSAAASMANHGLADLAMYEGKWADAETMLQAGMAEDEKSNNRVARSAKLIALAEVRLAEGQNAQALTAIKDALAIREDATLVPAALVLLNAGRTRRRAGHRR